MKAIFHVGDRVHVREMDAPGHLRTPYYVRGKCGIVERVLAAFPNPEERAFGRSGAPYQTLYRVRFQQTDLWPNYDGRPDDSVDVEIYQHWLEPVFKEENDARRP